MKSLVSIYFKKIKDRIKIYFTFLIFKSIGFIISFIENLCIFKNSKETYLLTIFIKPFYEVRKYQIIFV